MEMYSHGMLQQLRSAVALLHTAVHIYQESNSSSQIFFVYLGFSMMLNLHDQVIIYMHGSVCVHMHKHVQTHGYGCTQVNKNPREHAYAQKHTEKHNYRTNP